MEEGQYHDDDEAEEVLSVRLRRSPRKYGKPTTPEWPQGSRAKPGSILGRRRLPSDERRSNCDLDNGNAPCRATDRQFGINAAS
jgi:hypothetical protein